MRKFDSFFFYSKSICLYLWNINNFINKVILRMEKSNHLFTFIWKEINLSDFFSETDNQVEKYLVLLYIEVMPNLFVQVIKF